MGDDDDDRDEKLEHMRIEAERLQAHSDMLMTTALYLIIRNFEEGNVELGLDGLRKIHEYWRAKADR